MADTPAVAEPDTAVTTGQSERIDRTVDMHRAKAPPAQQNLSAGKPEDLGVTVALPHLASTPNENPVEAQCGGPDVQEPSIEEYMAALLARSRGATPRPSNGPASWRASLLPPDELSAVQPPPNNPAMTDEAPPTVAPAVTAAWSPTPAPEHREAISELRELANLSARTSFNVHLSQRLVFEMHRCMLVALVGLASSFITMLLTPSPTFVFFAASAVAWVIAAIWTWKYCALGRQLTRLCFPRETPREHLPSSTNGRK